MPDLQKFADRLSNIKESTDTIKLIIDIKNSGFEDGYRTAVTELGIQVNEKLLNNRFNIEKS